MKRYFVFIMALVLPSLQIVAQKDTSNQRLSIGDTVPHFTFSNILNYKQRSASLSDFKGKIVILDFWATWCMSCIKHFPILQHYQNKFKDKLQILLVNPKKTGDTDEQIKSARAKLNSSIPEGFTIPSVILDEIADSLFPHHLLPHYVWISPAGRIAAITGSSEITAENIEKMLQDSKTILREKIDMDIRKPLFLSGLEGVKGFYNALLIKGYVAGLPTANQMHDTMGCYGRTFANSTLLDLYKHAANAIAPDLLNSPKKIILEATNAEFITPPEKLQDTLRLQWEKDNLFTFQLLVPESQVRHFGRLMLEELNSITGYSGRLERRKIKCLVLKKTAFPSRIITKGGPVISNLYDSEKPMLQNSPISHLIARLNDLESLTLPVIDETGITKNIDIRFQEKFSGPEQVKKELMQYGLNLVETQRFTEVLVISKN